MAKDLFDTVRTSQNRLAGRGKSKENYACKGCVYLNEDRKRAFILHEKGQTGNEAIWN